MSEPAKSSEVMTECAYCHKPIPRGKRGAKRLAFCSAAHKAAYKKEHPETAPKYMTNEKADEVWNRFAVPDYHRQPSPSSSLGASAFQVFRQGRSRTAGRFDVRS